MEVFYKLIFLNHFYAISFALIVIPILSFPLSLLRGDQWSLSLEMWIIIILMYSYISFLLLFLSIYIQDSSKGNVRQYSLPNYKFLSRGWCFLKFLWFLSQIAFIFNLSRVIGDGSLVGGGRSYELSFGKYTLVNYLYFINGFIVGSSPLLMKLFPDKRKVLWMMTIFSFMSLPFHGVKSTIIFPIVIAVFCDATINRRYNRKLLILLVVSICIAFFLSIFFREGDGISFNYIFEKILLYLSPSYSNLQLQMQSEPFFTGGKLTFGFVDGIYDFISNGFQRASDRFDTTSIRGTNFDVLLVDDAYNTATIFRAGYLDFGYLGLLIVCNAVVAYLLVVQYIGNKSYNFFSVYVVSVSLVQALFMFWDNHFFRYQYIWWQMLALIFHFCCKYRLYWSK
ncbi:O-antigen polymerase [Aeromonas enterica]